MFHEFIAYNEPKKVSDVKSKLNNSLCSNTCIKPQIGESC